MRFAPGDPEVFAAGLLAAIDVDGGPTDEQRAVLRSVVHHVWQRPDLDLDALDPLTSAEVSARLSDDLDRLRFCELAMLLELCRHPQSPAQVECVEACAAALGVDGIEMATVRRALEQGAAVVAEDLERSYREILPEISELQLRDRYLTLDEPDPALGDRLRGAPRPPARDARATRTSSSTGATASGSPATTCTCRRTTSTTT